MLADGLGHGLYLTLLDYLQGTPYKDRLVSAEGIIGALRGRKTPAEIALIRAAVETTWQIYKAAIGYAQPGMTEKQIAAFMHEQMAAARCWPGLGTSQLPGGQRRA